MRNLVILIIAIFALASCKSSYDSAAVYDDVYYTPKEDAVLTSKSRTSKVVYGNTTPGEQYQQSSQPESTAVGGEELKSYQYIEDTLPAASSDDGEYYYVEETEEEYYDYDYASRINRFHNPAGSFGYYAPVYSGYYPSYGPSFSIGYGWGFPGSSFSMGFNYGWGGGYYNPWYYDPWYRPMYWGYPSYGWGYGGSYWAGYNHGWWNGYYAGGGGYYPGGGETIYPEHYYGPRNTRGSSIVGNSSARGSRINDGSGDDDMKNTIVTGRGSRTENTSKSGVNPQGNQRSSRTLEAGGTGGEVTERAGRQEKLARPNESGTAIRTESRVERSRGDERSGRTDATRRYAKPEGNNSGISESRRTQENIRGSASKQYTKPSGENTRGDVYSRTKRYAKPASESLSGSENRSGTTRRYTSPNTKQPRSSNEYTVPRSKPVRTYTTPSRSNNSFQTQQRNTRSYSSPTRSNRSYSTPSRNRSYSQPSRSTSQPSRSYSRPSRSSSSPARSSGSYSSPSRSSGSSSGSRSSGSSGSGRRGR